MPNIIRSALLPYPAETLFDIVNDIERYPEFLPWCGAAEIVERAPGQLVARLAVSAKGVSERFTTRNTMVHPTRVDLQLIDGPFERFEGCWHFTPLLTEMSGDAAEPAQQGCKVELRLDFAFSSTLLNASFGTVFARVAGSMVDAFCARAARLAEPLPVSEIAR